jgi:hypothetical protein
MAWCSVKKSTGATLTLPLQKISGKEFKAVMLVNSLYVVK